MRLVAPSETGRTHLLGQLAADMESRGFTVFHVTGRRSFRDQQYVALREAGLVQLRGAQSESDIGDELLQSVAPAAHPVLLIDDAEHLDLTSAYLLEQLRSRRDTPTVVVAPPFVMLDDHGRAASHKIRTTARLELEPLGYAQISLLAQRVLGAPAQPEVIARVLTMSSGITGIAVAILRSAAREQHIVEQENGWALNANALWNVHLRTTVEQMIRHLSVPELRALHALALSESVTTERFRDLARDELLGLTKQGLLTTFAGANGDTHVAPRPSLIIDYFQEMPIDSRYYEALSLLRELEDPAAKDRALTRTNGMVARAKTFDRTHNRGTGSARFHRTETAHLLARSAREWRREPSVPTAVAYLDLLLDTDTYAQSATRVFANPIPRGADPLSIRLGMHELFWATQAHPEEARERIEAILASETDETALAAYSAFTAYLVFSRYGMEPWVLGWWERAAKLRDGFSRSIHHFIGVITGRITKPLPGDTLDPAFDIQTFLVNVANTVLRFREASPDVYEQELHAEFDASRAGTDNRRITVSTYFLAQQQAATFRDLLATETVNVTLALGTPNQGYAVYFVAQLRWAAYLHYRHGEPDLARSVLVETERYPEFYGPLPAMDPAFGEAIHLLLEDDLDAAVALLLRTSEQCHAIELSDAAWTYAAVAFTEQPSDTVFAQLQRVGADSGYGSQPLMDLVRGALHGDAALLRNVQHLALDAEIATAITLLDAVCRQRQRDVPGASDPFSEQLAATMHELRALLASGLTIVATEVGVERQEAHLTKREREVTMLAATMQNREIADRLSLSVRTVENHLARAMKKLEVNSRSELSSRMALAGSA
ncbi:helix-turn-helix transcriptional regulator [Leucobacter luti]|uniref:Regulatory LuxR family protein n=1 Tax=Leucobacter luti TaxID=340320 RepID=A0A4Q7TZG9_9MICO|nr:LuxR C-terminal-related transcriptional regulator [Leucobacter luti]RZT66561.1 regulatory LuxR family protein [Leucobacter luti]